MWSVVACRRPSFNPRPFLWVRRVIVANKMQCPSTGQRRKKLAKDYKFLRFKWVKWADS